MSLQGLKQINEDIERRKPTGSAIKWLTIKDGQTVKIRFVNELDDDSPQYSPDRGVAIAVAEHTNPADYTRKIECSLESQGRCFGCEMNAKREKGWYSKLRFYVNVLVDDGENEPYVAVWSMGTRRSQTFDTIREWYTDEGSISDSQWRVKRTGSKTDTTYTLFPKKDTQPFDWTGIEPIDLTKVVNDVPYAEQEKYLLGQSKPEVSSNDVW